MIEVLKQALEALKPFGTPRWAGTGVDKANEAITSLSQAIAELESQEPVAWMDADGNVSDNNDHKCFPIPLYTHPPQEQHSCDKRTWVGLTDDEVYKIAFALEGEHWRKIADAIEAKLKEKNT